jgi:hypothetical protein
MSTLPHSNDLPSLATRRAPASRALLTPITLTAAARSFLRRRSPQIILPALAASVGLRVAADHWSWRDLTILAVMLALNPLAEWLTHAYLLHGALTVRGRRLELSPAREHRAHHEDPEDLDRALLPWDAVLLAVPLLAGLMWLISIPVHALLGGNQLALAASALFAAYLLLGVFEWSHFLIHTPYRPRGPFYHAVWRNHRLHHYQNEHYWFGITSTLGDRILRTHPRPADTPNSPTAHPPLHRGPARPW